MNIARPAGWNPCGTRLLRHFRGCRKALDSSALIRRPGPPAMREKNYFCTLFKKNRMAKEKAANDLDISETIGKTEQYVSENKKSLGIIGGAVLLIVGGYFVYNLFWVKPQEESARKEMFMAERYFSMDSLDLALNGDGSFPGFLEIIDNYGSSQSANLAHYYAGICYLKKGQFEDAVEFLSGYDAEDDITGALALGGLGDAWLELGDRDKALSYYKKAVKWDGNWFTGSIYSMKLALVYELNGEWDEARAVYERVKKEFPQSTDARDIDRFIARAEAMSAQ
jgi:tetratricopeptide (TPR) repeat protein